MRRSLLISGTLVYKSKYRLQVFCNSCCNFLYMLICTILQYIITYCSWMRQEIKYAGKAWPVRQTKTAWAENMAMSSVFNFEHALASFPSADLYLSASSSICPENVLPRKCRMIAWNTRVPQCQKMRTWGIHLYPQACRQNFRWLVTNLTHKLQRASTWPQGQKSNRL